MIFPWLTDVVMVVLMMAVLIVVGVNYLLVRKIFWKVRSIQVDLEETIVTSVLEQGRQQEILLQLCQLLDWPIGSLPPTRDWAASPDFLYEVARTVLKEAPDVVVELGGGVSTLVVGRCLELNRKGKLYSFDHEESYLQETRDRLEEKDLSSWVECRHAPLSDVHCGSDSFCWYALEDQPKKIDILIVDGPPEYLGDLSRYPAGPVLFPAIRDGGLVFLDDADRVMEKNVVQKWRAEFFEFTFKSVRAEKGMVLGAKASSK